MKVLTSDTTLTTQFYIDGHPDNPRDVLWRRLSPAGRAALAMTFRPVGDTDEAEVDIRLG